MIPEQLLGMVRVTICERVKESQDCVPESKDHDRGVACRNTTDNAGGNTDDPGLRSGMIRGAIRECVKGPVRLPTFLT